ncbi:MAG: PIN domain-containing protein [Chloroflexota bacterium]
MYLIDTNVWLERLLEQERYEEVGKFLDRLPSDRLFITDFAFHSIGVILCRLDQRDVLLRFVRDTFVDGSVTLLHLAPDSTQRLVDMMAQFNLDFDDAYQYTAAERYNLTLVSFDHDFDRTERGRKTPAEVLAA